MAIVVPCEKRSTDFGADGLRRRDHRLLLRRGGGHLRRAQPAVVEQHRIGERAADVDAEDRHGATIKQWEAGTPDPASRERVSGAY